MTSEESLFQRFGKDFARGAVLFREGDPGDEMFVVQRGRIEISKRVGESEKVLSTLGAGEFFGEMSVLSGRPRSATATCAEDARLLVVDGKTLEAMLRANGEIAVRMIRKLVERLQQANEQIETLLLPDATTRVAHFLTGLAERGGEHAIRAAELGSRVSLGSEELNGALAKLSRARVVTVQDGVVQVPDAARLRQFVEFLHMKAQFGEQP